MDFALALLAKTTFLSRLWDVFTTPSLTLFLLIGSAILVIGLLILTATRWGHARPITKCVILSVIAHILLLGYAYGTRMMFNHPVAKKQEAVNVNLIEYEYEDEIEETPDPNHKIVDDFVTEILDTETDSLQRPVPDSPFELQREFANETVSTNDVDGLQPQALEIANLDRQLPDFRVADENDFPPMQNQRLEIDPAPIDFQRRGAGEGDIKQFTPDFEPNNNPLQQDQQLQNVEIAPKLINNNAFPTKDQQTSQFESELELPDAQDSLVDDFAAATGIDPARRPQSDQGTAPLMPLGNGATDPAELLRAANSTRRLADGKALPVIYRLRKIANRREVAKLRGGSDQTEDAVEASLQWMANMQKQDGSWCTAETGGGREDKVYGHDRGGCGVQADMGITALATLSFLGAGHSHLEGEHQAVVQKALEFLIRHQAVDGDLSGNAKLFARMYCHNMSLLAISEALAVTGDYRLKPAVQRGVNFTVAAQDKTGGGWRYQAGDRGDMSQFGWVVLALHSARLGGVDAGPETRRQMINFLKSCQTGESKGLASYRPGEGPSTTMTAEALLCTYFLGAPLTPDGFAESKKRIMTELPRATKMNLYYWYYGTLALNQQQDADWHDWNQALQRALLTSQERGGQFSGSWPADGLWAGYGGRVYSTALATLNLQSYYRYLPANEIKYDQAIRIERLESRDIIR